jgi:hypothetical protein
MSLETLRQKQNRFAGMAARLILRAQQVGYDVTLGEAWRPPRHAALYDQIDPRAKNNLHVLRLAIDLNLFQPGGAIVNSLPDWWELHPDCRWGGRSTDPNIGCTNQESHYCLTYNGRE